MTQSNFKICYVLKNINNQKDSIISKFFDSAIDQLNWYKSTLKEKSDIDKLISNAANTIYKNDVEILNHAKKSAEISPLNNDLLLSFEILNNHDSFNEVNEYGKKIWLRTYLDSLLSSYICIGLLEKYHDTNIQPKLQLEYKELLDSLNDSLKTAYNLKSKSFWICEESSISKTKLKPNYLTQNSVY